MTSLGQGARITSADATIIQGALDEAFGYRGDVTICTYDGRRIEGFVFDRRCGPTLGESVVRILTAASETRIVVKYSEIEALEFTGRDTAAGKSWESWIRKYAQKRAAGETAEIACDAGD
ncbi:MAG: hypothetical protein EXS01_04480 [Phycisphaerales bacterium]|nr:hypothetical protein [Phycisphaerales bacterium]